MHVQSYLFFDGRCDEAIEFYKKSLGAQVDAMMRFKDGPEPTQPGMHPPGSEDKIMHAAMRIGDTQVMASDGRCQGHPKFDGFALTINANDDSEAHKVFDALAAGAWDVAFLAIDPVRAAGIDFTAPYVLIEGTYLVPDGSPLRAVDDVDRDGVRVAVVRGSAYDLHLSRTLKRAKIVRAESSPAALELFAAERFEAAAGVKQSLVAYAKGHPGVRVMDGRFMAIEP